MTRALARAVSVAIALLASKSVAAQSASDRVPTYYRDVAPIVQARCTTCHQRDGDAPFPLETYEQVRRRAALIARVTDSGYMPPWKPAADSMAFVGERRLSPEEKSILRRWVDGGAVKGDGGGASPHGSPPVWRWGAPDAIIELPAYMLPAASADVFRNFVVPLPFTGTRHVRAFQFRPRSSAVHHANIRVDPTTASAEMDAADPQPGYEGVILHSAQYPDGEFLGWTPGQAAAPDDRVAWTINGGSSLVVQLHMRPTGAVERVSPVIGLYFADAAPPHPLSIIRLGKQDLSIPAGASNWQSTDTFTLPVAAIVTAIQPHSHYRARDVRLTAERADGTSQTLLHIDDWDFAWQDRYRLREPLRLPAGTTLRSVFTFDNSTDNPRNPTLPPARAEWGWLSADEMADVWVQLTCDRAADCSTLTSAATRKATEEDAIGTEVLISRNPDHFNLRNDAALIYLDLGEPRRALTHFEAARRLKPDVASTHYNVATVLEQLGRLDDAIATYRDAVRINADYAPARARLARVLQQRQDFNGAIAEYQAAILLTAHPASLRCDLAKALLDVNRAADAITQFDAALGAEPDNVGCLIAVAWMRSAHEDVSIRDAALALRSATRAATLSKGSTVEPLALDSLAAALAATGRFAEAIENARRALSLATDDGLRAAIRERLNLYERGRPFRIGAQ